MTEVSILSTHSKKPSRIVPNSELEERLNLRPGIIERLTGIQKRHYLGEGESLQSLATDVCVEAIKKSGLNPSSLDMIIFYTDVPPTLPGKNRLNKTYYEISPHIQYLLRERKIYVNCECINIGGSCVAFISALEIAWGLIKSGIKKNILIVGASNCSSFLEKADKNVAMTFSDGAAATILGATEEKGFIDFYLMTEGDGYNSGAFKGYDELFIDRTRVAEFAPRAFQLAISSLLEKTKLRLERIDLFIPHQAGIRIIKKGLELSRIPQKKVYICLQSDGNTGAPAIQMALSNALREGRIDEGNLVVLVGFGTGWNYGATAFYYHQCPVS
jgi:3-oxoacyl-[acyl-carrier-protein] synthase-3